MEKDYIIGAVILIGLVSIFPLVLLHMSRKRQDEYLVSFYNTCNDLRDNIHTATSRAEMIELSDDLVSVRESYDNLIPHSVLDKEMKLLGVLLNRKCKKLK